MRYSRLSLWLKYANREPCIRWMIGAFVVGSAFFLFSALELAGRLPFLLDGQTVQATVLGKNLASASEHGPLFASISLFAHAGGGPRHVVQYQYVDLAGLRHIGSTSRLSSSAWNRLQPGDSLTIRYIRSDPARSEVASGMDIGVGLVFGLVGLALFSSSVVSGIGGIRWIGRQVRILRDGEAVAGRYSRVQIEKRGTRKGTTTVSVLEYESLNEFSVAGKLELTGRPLSNWQTGGNLLIAVDRENRTEYAADIFDSRSDDRLRLFGLPADPHP